MLRPYKYFHSEIQNIHSFVCYIVLEILCKAPKIPSPTFSSGLVLPKYRDLIDNVNFDYILNPLKESYRICKTLKSIDFKIIKRALHNNNRIRELCNGDLKPVLYDEIEKINKDLCNSIKAFCDFLYDKSITKEVFYEQYEKIEDYYKLVVGRSSICRCCGINKILTAFHTHRSALDHYLPKQFYPFTSINFKNLIPICDNCNSKYKLGKNTLFVITNKGKKNESRKRVKAFYPYSYSDPDIIIDIKLNKPYNPYINKTDIDLSLICTGYEEQIETWDRIFGIKENYIAECCSDEMYSYYGEQYNAIMGFDINHNDYIELLKNNKYGDSNFLKIAFLEAVK